MKRINLGLQGGGAHGAFTWGVLDRILMDDRIEIAAISGTSAGALNGAALKAGMIEKGREGARANLDWLWEQIGAISAPGFTDWVAAFGPATPFMAQALAYSPAYAAFDAASRMFSPYGFGTVFSNPLERIVTQFHYDAVCDDHGPELHICATNVRSGKIRVFSGAEIVPDAILASACLPTLFRAVEMDDPVTGQREAFWDGGYTGNPALFPLFEAHLPDDILVVNINPLWRDDLPDDPQSIQNRINEISFNSSLLRELRAIEFVQRLIADGKVAEGQMKRVLVHMIADDPLMNDLNVATKTLATPVVLARLKAAGQAAADTFLTNHFDDLNERETVDLRAMFS
ncbi:patatin-like phospholipase family protein [Octadecabacter sp. R77987]|uniref:patatin-like phospholipase family protein n=1 Tax=Octadecabacter sp. R77987 TaxID=3093874 RepID=UPI00366B18BD